MAWHGMAVFVARKCKHCKLETEQKRHPGENKLVGMNICIFLMALKEKRLQ